MDFNLTLIGQTIAMFVFVWFCMKFVWPPLIGIIEQRRTEIADGLAAGDRARRELDRAKEEVQKILAEARVKAVEVIDQATRRANTLIDEARAEGTKERERQVATAKVEIDQSIVRAREDMRDRVAELVLATAEKILDREVDAKTHKDLLDRLAAQI